MKEVKIASSNIFEKQPKPIDLQTEIFLRLVKISASYHNINPII
jgi:hypothetical protein